MHFSTTNITDLIYQEKLLLNIYFTYTKTGYTCMFTALHKTAFDKNRIDMILFPEHSAVIEPDIQMSKCFIF